MNNLPRINPQNSIPIHPKTCKMFFFNPQMCACDKVHTSLPLDLHSFHFGRANHACCLEVLRCLRFGRFEILWFVDVERLGGDGKDARRKRSGARISGFKKVDALIMTVIGKSMLNTDETKKRWVNKKAREERFLLAQMFMWQSMCWECAVDGSETPAL